MTQKFTAEEVRKEADFLSTYSRKTSRMLEAYADTLSQPADSGRVGDDERQWRELLAIRVAGPMLYTDDGELSDTTTEPCIDFLRDSADTIACKLADRARATLAAQGQGDRLPAELDAWLQERGLVPDLGEDGSFDMSDLIVALNDHENALMASRPAPPASPAGVPDVYAEHGEKALTHISNALDDLCDSQDQRAVPQLREAVHHIKAMIAAAPSAPEGDGGAE